MKIINFTQGTDEWLKWRNYGIGASEIAIILRSSPYKTPLQLWEVKCGFAQEDVMNPAMAHGVKNEPIARAWMNKHHGLNLEPICIEDDEISYVRASLDGYDAEKGVVCEIKCPVKQSIIDDAREKQIVPDFWFHQAQWQIMISKPQRFIFAIWDYRNKCCITVEMFGEENLHYVMKEKAKIFWHGVQIGKPPEALDKDHIKIEAEGLKPRLDLYQDIGERINLLKEEQKTLKNEIVDFGDDGSFMAYGYKVTRMAARTTYDVDQMRLDGIDIDKYARKSKSIGAYRISRQNGLPIKDPKHSSTSKLLAFG